MLSYYLIFDCLGCFNTICIQTFGGYLVQIPAIQFKMTGNFQEPL